MAGSRYRVVRPDRYFRFSDEPVRVEVKHGNAVVADCSDAILLFEGDRDAVAYLLADALVAATLTPSDNQYRCRWKGDARYYHVDINGARIENAVWSYPDAPDELASLRGRLAFDSTLLHVEQTSETEIPA